MASIQLGATQLFHCRMATSVNWGEETVDLPRLELVRVRDPIILGLLTAVVAVAVRLGDCLEAKTVYKL